MGHLADGREVHREVCVVINCLLGVLRSLVYVTGGHQACVIVAITWVLGDQMVRDRRKGHIAARSGRLA